MSISLKVISQIEYTTTLLHIRNALARGRSSRLQKIIVERTQLPEALHSAQRVIGLRGDDVSGLISRGGILYPSYMTTILDLYEAVQGGPNDYFPVRESFFDRQS